MRAGIEAHFELRPGVPAAKRPDTGIQKSGVEVAPGLGRPAWHLAPCLTFLLAISDLDDVGRARPMNRAGTAIDDGAIAIGMRTFAEQYSDCINRYLRMSRKEREQLAIEQQRQRGNMSFVAFMTFIPFVPFIPFMSLTTLIAVMTFIPFTSFMTLMPFALLKPFTTTFVPFVPLQPFTPFPTFTPFVPLQSFASFTTFMPIMPSMTFIPFVPFMPFVLFVPFIPCAVQEPLPVVRKIATKIEEAPAVTGQTLACGRARGSTQQNSSLACREPETQDRIGQRIKIEVVILRRQFDSPTADCAHVFER